MTKLEPSFVLAFAATLLLLTGGSLAQDAPGIGTLKSDVDNALKTTDVQARETAIKALAAAGGVEPVRHLMRAADVTARAILEARVALLKISATVSEAQTEVNRVRGLVNAKRMGERTLNERVAELDQAKAKQELWTTQLKADEATAPILRRTIGWAVQRCEGRDLDTAAGLIRQTYSKSKDIQERAHLLKIMVWVDHKILQDEVLAATTDAAEPIRVAALDALEDRGGSRALEPALAALKDSVWQVRASAIRILRKVGGRKAVASLIEAMNIEDGRLATDALQALRHVTAQDFHDNVHLWREWLAKSGDSLAEPTDVANAPPATKPAPAPGAPAVAKAKGTGFYGIDSKTKHPVFVIDYSGSMSAATGGRAPPEGQSSSPPKIGGARRVDGVATELTRFIETLPRDGTFNIVLFDHRIMTWKDKMQPATLENKEAAKAWILERGPDGATDLFGGLEKAFEFAGRGSFDKHYGVGLDTIFLLSDGSPTAGRLQKEDEILAAVRELNQLKRISVHTVGLGRQLNTRLLRRLAEENDGGFAHIEQ